MPKFFSKLKDYNYILDPLREKKCFKQDVKNLLLSMVYKIETSYKDYSKIKRNNITKNEFIENVIIKAIRDNCKYIYLIDPKDDEKNILEEQNTFAITNESEKKIYSYPTEVALLYGLSDIRPKYFFIGSKYNYLKRPFQDMLVEGSNLNNTEVLRNFNGWSWNVTELDKKINNTYNCMYQTLSLLFGHAFLEIWENDFSGKKDYISEMRKRMEEGYGKNIADDFSRYFGNLVILSGKEQDKEKAKKTLEKLLIDYDAIKDKNLYIYKASEEKKKLRLQNKRIEKISSNRELLLKEYNLRNKDLPENKKIFNVSELAEILNNEKEKNEKTIEKLTNLTKPAEYNKNKALLEEKISILKPVGDKKATTYKYLILLQKTFLKCVSSEIEDAETKEDYLNLIYMIRYYRNLRVTAEEAIKDVPELNNILNKIACKLVTKMCQKSIFNIFCQDIAMNYKIILQALNSNIADLEDIDISLRLDKPTKRRLFIEIYDNDTIDSSMEIEYQLDKKDLRVRQKKHVPLVDF